MASYLIVICLISLATWFATLIKMLVIRQSIPLLGHPQEQYKNRSITVVVPARDEERDIGQAIGSLLTQEGLSLELLVVNDHSSDRTGAIIDALAETDTRLVAIHNPELQPGWFGKANAMQTAARQARGDYLLFTDADVIHDSGVIWSAISEMESGNYDFMTLVPRFEMRTFWENVDLPMIFSGLAMLASRSLEDPDSPDAVGGGAFLLVRRSVFEAVGGFESIRHEMLDDVGLARLIKSRGYKVGIRSAIDRLHVELFKTNRDAVLAPTKNILMSGMGRPWLAAPAALLALVLYWSPVAAVILGLVQDNSTLWQTGTTAYLIQYFSFYLARSTFRFHPLKVLAYPLVVVVVFVCTSRALYYYYVKKSVVWRGRVIKYTD